MTHTPIPVVATARQSIQNQEKVRISVTYDATMQLTRLDLSGEAISTSVYLSAEKLAELFGAALAQAAADRAAIGYDSLKANPRLAHLVGAA